MSRIIDKPFDWGQKIIRAVFKGKPNLITAPDLNRQHEILRNQSRINSLASRPLVEDITIDYNKTNNKLSVSVKGLFYDGIKYFETPEVLEKTIIPNNNYYIYCIARRKFVSNEDDQTKEISGAKFDDSSTSPAAEHYVMEDPKLYFVTWSAPHQELNYNDLTNKVVPGEDNREFISLIGIFRYRSSGDKALFFNNTLKLSELTTNEGGRILASSLMDAYTPFQENALSVFDYVARNDIYAFLYDLLIRQYDLGKRLFADTLYHPKDTTYTINSRTFNRTRYCRFTGFSVVGQINIMWYIIGNMCYVSGQLISQSQDATDIDATITLGEDYDNGQRKCPMPEVIAYRSNDESWVAVGTTILQSGNNPTPSISVTKENLYIRNEDELISGYATPSQVATGATISGVGAQVWAEGKTFRAKFSRNRQWYFNMQYPIKTNNMWKYSAQDINKPNYDK